MTARALAKPCGYAGDATLIDFMYRHPSISSYVDAASNLGQAIYRFVSDVPGARDVRERRAIIGRRIDEVIRRGEHSRILSVGSGAMRELDFCCIEEHANDRIEITLLDSDPRSLAIASIDREGRRRPFVRPIEMDIRKLLKSGIADDSFDLIYAAGLFDYLPDGIASRLTAQLFSALTPGGELLLANFLPIWESGYMETFMDWHLIYRNERSFARFASRLDSNEVQAKRFFVGSKQSIGYLVITRRRS